MPTYLPRLFHSDTMNQEINFLADISSPFKRTLVIRQRIYSLAGENEIALGLTGVFFRHLR